MTTYYYTVGYFQHPSIPGSKFNHWGWDVRTWVLTNITVTLTEEEYNRIVNLDKFIVKAMKDEFDLTIETWHKPFKIEL